VVEAMRKGYAGTGDYYGKLKRQFRSTNSFADRLKGLIPPQVKKLYRRYKKQEG
jgi:hypothetical protein